MARRKVLQLKLSPNNPPSPPNLDLQPFTGPWDKRRATHLLRRCLFGPNRDQVQQALSQGLTETIHQLFNLTSLPDPPVNFNYTADPNVPIGSTWIEAPYTDNLQNGYRRQSLRAWTMELMTNQGFSIREKLWLFWHNHFVTGDLNDPKYDYHYGDLLRRHALGNFKTLTEEITINPSMLRYLNGNQNTKEAPNENYSRELMELFTLGKGPQVAPGDYTNYTEDDVVQMARVLTGWVDRGFNARRDIAITAEYINNRHDTGTKTLSHRFQNRSISNQGDKEYLSLIGIIFEQPEVARFIVRKLYRWFVYYTIDEHIEEAIITPLAQQLREENYEIAPVLRRLLSSNHFYDDEIIGAIIKNPIDFILGSVNQLEIKPPNDQLEPRYTYYTLLARAASQQQMELYNPPDVAGWKAYYQEPVYYRQWINATTLQQRKVLTDAIATGASGSGGLNRNLKLDVLKFISGFSDPKDPNVLITELAELLLPQPISTGQHAALKEILIPGLPDYEWTVEYNDYLDNPNNTNLKRSLTTKLANLWQAILAMPEYLLG